MAYPKLTLQEGLDIQSKHLKEWETILKSEVFKRLEDYIKIVNLGLDKNKHDGYNVWRGNTIDNLVANYKIGHQFGEV